MAKVVVTGWWCTARGTGSLSWMGCTVTKSPCIRSRRKWICVIKMVFSENNLQCHIRPPEVRECSQACHTASICQTSLMADHVQVEANCPYLSLTIYSPGLSNGSSHSQEPYIVYKGYLFFWDNAKTLQIKTPTFFKTSLKCSDEIKQVWFKDVTILWTCWSLLPHQTYALPQTWGLQ